MACEGVLPSLVLARESSKMTPNLAASHIKVIWISHGHVKSYCSLLQSLFARRAITPCIYGEPVCVRSARDSHQRMQTNGQELDPASPYSSSPRTAAKVCHCRCRSSALWRKTRQRHRLLRQNQSSLAWPTKKPTGGTGLTATVM
jgi:hypothetical protein